MQITPELVKEVNRQAQRWITNPYDRDDIVQETLLVMFKSEKDLWPGAVMRYCTIAFFKTHKRPNIKRKKNGKSWTEVIPVVNFSDYDVISSVTPEYMLELKRKRQAVMRATESLTGGRKAAAEYYLSEGKIPGYTEYSGLRTFWVEAKQILRKRLKGFDFFDEDVYTEVVRLYEHA